MVAPQRQVVDHLGSGHLHTQPGEQGAPGLRRQERQAPGCQHRPEARRVELGQQRIGGDAAGDDCLRADGKSELLLAWALARRGGGTQREQQQ